MKKSVNHVVVAMFMASLMLMGMAGLPFTLFEETRPSPHFVAAIRLTFVGVLALAVGVATSIKYPQKKKTTKTDIKDWLIFVALAVIGVNCALTYALYYLDDRMAMAVMFVAIGVVFILHHPTNGFAWLAAIFAVSGTALLAFYGPEQEKIDLVGVALAAIGGTAQGFMFFKKQLMPKNIDPGIALGSGFLLGGLSMIAVAVTTTPLTQPLAETPMFLIGMFASALMTILAWLILGYGSEKMSGSQKVGATSFEPVGAAFSQFIKNGVPVTGEIIGVVFLVASAVMAIFVKKHHEADDAN